MAFALFGRLFHGVAQESSHYTCYRASGTIHADGLLNEADWALADWSSAFIDITGDPKLKPELLTRVKLLWDDSALYIAAELREPHVWGTIKKRDAVIFHDNDFEVFLDPEGNGVNYMEFEINALNTLWDLMLTKPYKDFGKPVTAWNLDGIQTGVRVFGSLNDPSDTDSCWVVEMALPMKQLVAGRSSAAKPADGVQWRVNFSRVEWETEIKKSRYVKKTDPVTRKPLPEKNWVWSPIGVVSMHLPDRWGRLEFSTESVSPPPVRFRNDSQKKNFGIRVWMNGYPQWSDARWDSVLGSLKQQGVTCLLTQASPAVLARIIPLAAKHGILIQKWFIALMNNDSALIHDHSDWFVINRNNRSSIDSPAYVGYYRFLCPSNQQVRNYLSERLKEYLDIPGLEGIHLDYIRYPDVILPRALWGKYGLVQDREYPQFDYCYCGLCRARFSNVSGIDPMSLSDPSANERWFKYRLNQVTSLVSELTEIAHAKGKKLSAAVFPGPSLAKRLVRQDWGMWPVDEIMPMLYHSFYFESLDWIRAETAEGVDAVKNSVPYYSGLYVPSLSPRELQTALKKSLEGGATGISLFSFEAMTPAHWKALRLVLPAR